MPDLLEQRLSRLDSHAREFDTLPRGIEKESLRITPDGRLSTTDHPVCLGSALTHSEITTDYSEALMELVTPVTHSARSVHQHLEDLHAFVHSCLDDELLWTTSMPCIVPQDDLIPVAKYGSSNVGQMKHVYRIGLGHRYGRVMQTIAGIHYNVSMPEAFWEIDREIDLLKGPDAADSVARRSHAYFGMVRNVHRHGWLLMYLLGASPAVCKSFVSDRDHGLEEFDSGSVYAPYGTSLRMSGLGYQNNAQDSLDVRYNDLYEYADSLVHATRTPHPEYERIGIQRDGVWRQLNTNILQIENEYYAVVRPKRVALSGEKPSHALRERGVEYVELRAIDLDPFEASGISVEAIRFLDVFALFCMLDSSDIVSDEDQRMFSENQTRVVMKGRAPDTRVWTNSREQGLQASARTLMDKLDGVASFLDRASGGTDYAKAIALMSARVDDPDATPSARVLREMRENNERFADFGLRLSRQHREQLLQRGLADSVRKRLQEDAQTSLKRQRKLEADDSESFGDYLATYMAD